MNAPKWYFILAVTTLMLAFTGYAIHLGSASGAVFSGTGAISVLLFGLLKSHLVNNG